MKCAQRAHERIPFAGEILRAVVTGKPLFALLELEAKHGGLTREEIHAALLECDTPVEKHGLRYTSKYAMWGLDKEVESWGYRLPTGNELSAALFKSDPIEWARIGAFQVR